MKSWRENYGADADGKTVETIDADKRIDSKYFDSKQVSKIWLSQFKGLLK